MTSTDIMVECKACGREFVEAAPQDWVGRAHEDPEPGGPVILGNAIMYTCPHCGVEKPYRRDETRFAD
jgi:predicted RNA-binding Zn-ribbon protein involved in translation (DUF1610 family)